MIDIILSITFRLTGSQRVSEVIWAGYGPQVESRCCGPQSGWRSGCPQGCEWLRFRSFGVTYSTTL